VKIEKKKYLSPKIKNLGNAKNIINNVFIEGSGDTFPATTDILTSG
tara:strand:- start:413 stop:550 length:138 start_codon:yes stop_codon:yes gene_type:complete